MPPSGRDGEWKAGAPPCRQLLPTPTFPTVKQRRAVLTSVVAAGILKRLALVDAVEALAAAVEVGRARAPGGPAACSRYSGGAW